MINHSRRARSFTPLVVLLCTAALFAQTGAEPRPVSPPQRVSLRLDTEPAPLVCSLRGWSDAALVVRTVPADEERTVPWTDLQPAQAYDIARRLIDPKDAPRWVWLGLLMLTERDEPLARRAFDVAARLDPALRPKADEALRLHKSGEDPSTAFAPAPEPAETPAPSTTQPPPRPRRGVDPQGAQSGGGPVQPWPALSDEQYEAYSRAARDQCAELLAKINTRIEPVETQAFLLYSEMPRAETDRWAAELDKMYVTLIAMLDIPKGSRLFQGRAPIFIFRDRERFLEFEHAAFRLNAENAGGVNHQRDGYTFTVFYRIPDNQAFNSTLIHETVHAFMYRYRSPARLPTWANEGLADYIAALLVPHSTAPQDDWQHTREFVRQKRSALDIMKQNYADRSWPTDDSYPVSHMLVRFMLKHKPRAFKEWLDDIKGGTDPTAALQSRFNVTPERLAQGFAQDIAAEPRYTRPQ
ncbi:MAG TPA: hypothetical protein DEB06_10350 [Phycisphaerales bacterium]|nr:hypothetical protein [Phycisphaerales bacterium]